MVSQFDRALTAPGQECYRWPDCAPRHFSIYPSSTCLQPLLSLLLSAFPLHLFTHSLFTNSEMFPPLDNTPHHDQVPL